MHVKSIYNIYIERVLVLNSVKSSLHFLSNKNVEWIT